ncbi:MAG: carboxypeptidase regulatory-like domain-containing protein [Bacteroidetes bacterium]|nr:carboxypeptidase regulatory-like domain-containing protein [Bacteroidota bacterium]
MKTTHFIVFLFLILVLPYSGKCTIIHIPETYSTIQEGIDASVDGDVVLVDPGTYYEHLNLNGKNIVLCSKYFTTGNTAFIASTIIDGSNTGRVITISQYETSSCQVVGFTIQHGNATSEPDVDYGGGILVSDASPQILHCIIQNNYAPEWGGGVCIYAAGSSMRMTKCTIQNNTADSFGGGVFMGDCSPDAAITECIISGNTITCACDWNGGGGGVTLYHAAKLANCLIKNNSAPNSSVGGGGVHCDWGDELSQSILVIGCTIVNNTALNNGGVSYVIAGGEFRNCIIWGNTDGNGNSSNYDGNTFVNCCTDPLPSGTGNISSDPVFINPVSGNFRLASGSPCIDAGDNAFNTETIDLDGNSRVYNGLIDMGAYESGAGTGMTVQIGDGPNTYIFPIYSCYNYNYSQQIYLGSEITAGGGTSGLITKIRFLYVVGGSQFSNWNNWTVYLGNTSRTEFTSNSDWVPLAGLNQVFSGVITVTGNGTWVEITLPTPFYYSGDNIVVAVDENSNGYDCSALWGSYYCGSNRGLLFFDDGVNPNPAAPPNANIGPDGVLAQVQFQLNPAVGTLYGFVTEEPNCTVPIEGATVVTGTYSTTTDASGHYQLNLPVGSYDNITAIYHDASQTISPVDITQGSATSLDFCLAPYYAPPVNFQASVTGPVLNNAHLTWMAPGSIPDQWIRWNNGSIYGGLGYNGPATFSVASRWPVADIAPYNGTYLKKIRFIITEATATYTLKVWKGTDASTLLLSQVVTDPIINAWCEVTLTTPILIDGTQEFWFGYEIVQTTGYPAGLSGGPAVTGKGDMINSGYGWFSVKEAWGWEFNWLVDGFISENPALAPQQLLPLVQSTLQIPYENNPIPASVKPGIIRMEQNTPLIPSNLTNKDEHASAMSPLAPSSTLTGYNIYRDNVKIGDNVPNLFYDDPNLPWGGYNYEVSAQYDFGESARVGPLHVDIYTCFPPTGLSVPNATLTTTSASLSWTPSTISTNLEWSLEWGPAGFTPGYGTYVQIAVTPEYTLTGLIPGTEYDFYVNTYCSSTDESAWIKKTFRTHYFNCPAGATAETESCGANTNGCDLVPPAFETISCGETKCGTAWLHRSQRDSDWYSFTLTEPNDVTLTGNSEFTGFFSFASSPCPSTVTYTSTTNNAGSNIQIVTQLGAAGTYFVNVAPSYAEQVVCDSLSRYWIKITCNTCLTPTALHATNITSTSADLGWTSGAGLWNIEWGITGFSMGTGTVINGTGSNPYHLSGLTEGYSYSFYVQGDCGGGQTSNWAGPYTFYLPCPAISLPYAEDFMSQTVGITPQCWEVKKAGSPTNWIVDLNNYAGGEFPQLAFFPYNPYFSDSSMMTSPVMNTTGQASLNLSFKQYINAYSSGTFCKILTTSNGGHSWQTAWSNSMTGVLGPLTTTLSITTPDVGSATFQFAFAVIGNSWEIGTWQIDDITLTGVPQTGTLEGIVTACSGASLLAGGTVTAGLNTTTTNASGLYQFLNIPVGTYSVGFSKTGYVTKTVPGVQVLYGTTTTLDECLDLTGPPVTRTVQNETILNGQSTCYDATQTITVAGGGTTFIVSNGGSVTMIAGVNIDYLQGTRVYAGGYMHGKIAPGGPWCGVKSASFVEAGAGEDEKNPTVAVKPEFRIYPNPTNDKFNLELTGRIQAEPVRVEIYGMRGEMVLSKTLPGERIHEFSLSGKPAGIYFIKVAAGETVMTAKLVKTR